MRLRAFIEYSVDEGKYWHKLNGGRSIISNSIPAIFDLENGKLIIRFAHIFEKKENVTL